MQGLAERVTCGARCAMPRPTMSGRQLPKLWMSTWDSCSGRRYACFLLIIRPNISTQVDSDPFYDWTLVKKVRKSLKAFREKDDARGVLGVLEVCCRANFAGTESARLYSQVRIFHVLTRCSCPLICVTDLLWDQDRYRECVILLGSVHVRHAELGPTAYLDEVVSALEYIRKTSKLTTDEKRRFFK